MGELGLVRDSPTIGGHDSHGLRVDKALMDGGLSDIQRLGEVDLDVVDF